MAYYQTCVDSGKSYNYLIQRSSCIDCGKVAASHVYTPSIFTCTCHTKDDGTECDTLYPIFVRKFLALLGFGEKNSLCFQRPLVKGSSDESTTLNGQERSDGISPPASTKEINKHLEGEEAQNVQEARVPRKRRRSQSADSRRSRLGSKNPGGSISPSRPSNKRSASPSPSPLFRRSTATASRLSKQQQQQQQQPSIPKKRPPISPIYSSKRYLLAYEPKVVFGPPSREGNETPGQINELSRAASDNAQGTEKNEVLPISNEEQELSESRSQSCPPELITTSIASPAQVKSEN